MQRLRIAVAVLSGLLVASWALVYLLDRQP